MTDKRFIGYAPTLKDLRQILDKAIEICGPDAEWWGFDDGNIYIHVSYDTQYHIECKQGAELYGGSLYKGDDDDD